MNINKHNSGPSTEGGSPEYYQPDLPSYPSEEEIAKKKAEEQNKYSAKLHKFKIKIMGTNPPESEEEELDPEPEKQPSAWEDLHGTNYHNAVKKHRKKYGKHGSRN